MQLARQIVAFILADLQVAGQGQNLTKFIAKH
jgi:hypothetical protein